MIDAGKAYNAANKQFVSGIRELAQQSTTDEVIEVNNKMMSLTTFCLASPAQHCVLLLGLWGGCVNLPSKIYYHCDQSQCETSRRKPASSHK